ncbi:receptor protein kinase TMK1-like [Tasmannia lanceolata]|uniref:receptor protein kinase TMK1-like n=1 Tax=Tasmannia lanceolata TaxID=3420 RepID=UPI0040640916
MKEDLMKLILFIVYLSFSSLVLGDTEPNDLEILMAFKKGLENPELLNWPSDGTDPCGPPWWKHVVCVGTRVSQIQVAGIGLKGPLPQNFNQLTELSNIGLQKNQFTGKLPSFSGLSKLVYAFLGNNQFDTIPSDFFVGLDSLQVLSLDYNSLNKTTGWSLPSELKNSAQLMNLSLISCNLVGPLPDFLGGMPSLTALKLSYNQLSGGIPESYRGSELQVLWLNNQGGSQLSGSLDIVASMLSMKYLWLHGNQFTGTIPEGFSDLSSLTEMLLNDNQLVGPIPESLTTLPLEKIQLDHNKLTGTIPKFSGNFSGSGNSFCQSDPEIPCAPEVTALLDFLSGVNYPLNLASSWSGNDPCTWLGISCNVQKVSVVNVPKARLNGTLSPSLGKLDSLVSISLGGNNLSGQIPTNLTDLKFLRLLDLSRNNFERPVPTFSPSVRLLINGNPLLDSPIVPSPTPNNSPPENSQSPSSNNSAPNSQPRSTPNSQPHSTPNSQPQSTPNSQPQSGRKSNSYNLEAKSKGFKRLRIIIEASAGLVILLLCVLGSVYFFCRKKKGDLQAPNPFTVHPRDPSDPDTMVKIAIADSTNRSTSILTASGSQSRNTSGTSESQLMEIGNLVISVQVLRNATKNFAPENELGRGGFGTVYMGELDDGTLIAVKRMEAAVITSKGLDEFQAEIAVLSKVRHRHLVTLMGYSIQGNERLLVYEYMPQGALSKHLFHWEKLQLEPLSWKRRLNIALDVARAMEYLHSLAHRSFIHRDLKSSNILLGDNYRAKVSDFGLVKLAPDGKHSVATRLAGTFGYLAPEYAVTGKVTTKADVFSFGVVLMELVTGLAAIDEDRPEESRYLVEWFWRIKSSKETLLATIDPSLDVTDESETFESICVIAELAGHCTARDLNQRPEMGHAVNTLSPMVEKWKPANDDQEEYLGIDCSQPLHQMVKKWQAADGPELISMNLDDSKGSIPARPTGFAESFTSADGR